MMSDPALRNLLFIGVDQLRWDAIWPHKVLPAVTPNLDRLMQESISFDRAYTSCPLCTPARASIFTGDYAFTHGMGTNCDMYHALARELADPGRLLHHDLARAGYRCGFVGKWHVGATRTPADCGFESDSPSGYGSPATMPAFRAYLDAIGERPVAVPRLYQNPGRQTLAAGDWGGPQASTPAHFLTDRTIAMLERFGVGERPFFATVQYWDPHGPHLVSDEFLGVTDRSRIRPWPNFHDSLDGKPRRVRRERDDFYRLHPRTEAEVVDLIGWYCDHLAMLDAEIGRLLDHLERTGLARTTLVVFTADHGDMTGSHGGLIDKGLPYEEAMRVPLAFRHPSLGRGRRDALAMTMDVLPTALDLLGVPFAPRQATSLAALVADPSAPRREAMLAEYHGLRFLCSQRILVSDDGWKYVFTPGDDDELYHLVADPHELENLAGDAGSADRLAGMRRRLIAETARFGDPLRDCVAKFNGVWRTGSGQFDVTSLPAA